LSPAADKTRLTVSALSIIDSTSSSGNVNNYWLGQPPLLHLKLVWINNNLLNQTETVSPVDTNALTVDARTSGSWSCNSNKVVRTQKDTLDDTE